MRAAEATYRNPIITIIDHCTVLARSSVSHVCVYSTANESKGRRRIRYLRSKNLLGKIRLKHAPDQP